MSYLASYKQNTLVSGTNIKTVNSNSLLGSGNITVQDTLVSGTNIKTINGNSLLGSGDLVVSGGVTSVTGTSPIISSGGSTPAISIQNAAADGTTKGAATFAANDFNAVSGVIAIDYTNGKAANTTDKGFLTNTDWNTFNNKQDAITNGFGLTGTTTKAVSLTTASAYITAETSISTTTYADITGASITLAAGTWVILSSIYAYSAANTIINVSASIRDGANTVITEGGSSTGAMGTGNVGYICIALHGIVSPSVSTVYKLSAARNNPANNATIDDGNAVNINSDKGTHIMAFRIA